MLSGMFEELFNIYQMAETLQETQLCSVVALVSRQADLLYLGFSFLKLQVYIFMIRIYKTISHSYNLMSKLLYLNLFYFLFFGPLQWGDVCVN